MTGTFETIIEQDAVIQIDIVTVVPLAMGAAEDRQLGTRRVDLDLEGARVATIERKRSAVSQPT